MRVPVLLVAVAVLSACGQGGTGRPDRLRVGLIAPVPPDAGEGQPHQRDRFAPVAAYLEAALHLPVSVSATRDLDDLTADFEAGRFDIAMLGAAGFAHAHQRIGAVPLVVRESDRYITAVFLAAADDERATLRDFGGGRLTFGPRFSSSHIMARHYLEKQGIVPEQFFRDVDYSPNSDDTALLVPAGRYDLVVSGGAAVAQLLQAGALRSDQIRIVWETPPYVTSVWAASLQLPEDLRVDVRNAFLALSAVDPAHAGAMTALNASAFLPASLDDYADLTAVMRRMQLFDADLASEPPK